MTNISRLQNLGIIDPTRGGERIKRHNQRLD